ncbi:MAG: UDP-N-acetylmuramate--L-alanine ligase [Caldimicrobium sp.]|nr:UDP-N-acetylmuramate--L-alanine ligase [Caldimicrobium sp.]MCX7873501.1 UDP-N-acetylmuramate--L-alanine ligase [Caldimicrobium sp.]MDW8093827.1 UDP-N-acetylmuramate--L-alanine ligase [Caldimicrobium sp.]
MLEKKRKIHFIGIGGVGMSGLALLLNRLGHRVTGCDLSRTKYIEPLISSGIDVYLGHDPTHLEDAEIVVYSSAVPRENIEIRTAKEKGLLLVPRARMLSEVMQAYPKSIVVAGSHGKTTTTSLIAEILLNMRLNPTVVVGGIINNIKTNSLLGKSEYLVAEADESDGTFLLYSPFIEVITNIDREHLDFYADFQAIKKAFMSFILKAHPEGKVILCIDDLGVREVVTELSGPFLYYGFSPEATLRGKIIEESAHPLVEVYYGEKKLGRYRLGIPGKHNALNALGAIGVALFLGLPLKRVFRVLEQFKGVKRRLECKGIYKGALLIDDYAHHPREIQVTLSTLRGLYPDKRLILCFQPHRYSRTRALWEDFLLVLREPEVLVLTEIYPANEEPLPGITGETFYQATKEIRGSKPTFFAKTREEVLAIVRELASEENIILTMGAGNIYKVHEELIGSIGQSTYVVV